MSHFVVVGAGQAGSALVAKLRAEGFAGDITLIAVDKRYRRRGIATSLLREALRLNKADSVKAINTEAGCESLTAFLEAANIAVTGRQFEMVKKI